MTRGNHNHFILVAASASAPVLVGAASELELADGEAPRRVKLLPMGRIEMRDGRGPYFLRDRAHAERVVAATRQWLGGADFMFDYDHQAIAASRQDGSTARASGWAKPANLIVEDDGIYADDIDWTAAGAAAIASREYRYVSPTFLAAKATGDVLQLKNTALVNIGAIDLPAIAAGFSEEEDGMDKIALLALLGLPADASDEQIAAAVNSMKGAVAASSTIALAVGLASSASVEEVSAAVTELKKGQPDPSKFVPVEQVTAMNQRLTTLEGERAEQVVASAIEGGKLVPALKGWALGYFKKDEAGFNAWLKDQPVVVGAGTVITGDRQTNANGLSAEEISAAAAIGMSEADMLEAKKEEADNGAR